MISVADLALAAPLCALAPVKADECSVVHAVSMESIVATLAGRSMVSACGLEVKILSLPLGSDTAVLWPVSTRGLPAPLTRCRMCWAATGRKRPRARLGRNAA